MPESRLRREHLARMMGRKAGEYDNTLRIMCFKKGKVSCVKCCWERSRKRRLEEVTDDFGKNIAVAAVRQKLK